MNKNMAISVLGVMVAVPAKGAIPSTKYIQEAINNMSTPAGSVITGYGSVDGVQPYLLAGTGTGSAGWLSYSDLVSGLSGYLKGSVITGYADANSGSYILVGSGGTGNAGWMPGSRIASGLGSYIRGYETVTADVSHVLGGSGDDATAGWLSYEKLASGLGGYLKGSQISGYGMGTGSEASYLLAGSNTTGSPFFVSVSNLGSRIGGYGYYNGNGSMILVGSGTGSAGWLSYSLFGADIGGYMTGIKGSAIWWDTTTGSAAFILAGSETGKLGKASWLSYEDLASGLSPYLGGGGGASVPAGSVITGYGSTNQASHVLVGTGGSSTANWISYGNLASGLGVHLGSKVMGYGWRSSASHILAGTGDGSAAWMSYEDFASGLSPYLGGGGGASVPAGSVITGYESVDGLQPYLLAGTGTGSAGWMLWSTLLTGMGGPISYVLSGSVIHFTGSTSTGAYVFAGGSYAGTGAWMSYSNLAAGLGSYLGSYLSGIRGSVIHFTGSTSTGAYVFAGGSYAGTGAWMSYSNLAAGLGSYLGSYLSGIRGSVIHFTGSTSTGAYVFAGGSYAGTGAWLSYSNLAVGLGSHIGSYIPGSYLSDIRGSVVTGYGSMSYASHVLVGSGGSSAAYWMSYSGLASGLGSYIGSYIPGSYLSGIRGSVVTGYGSRSYASHVLVGSGWNSAAYWMSYSDLAAGLVSQIGSHIGSYLTYVPGSKVVDYGNAIAGASRVLAGTGMGSAGWLSYEDLATQLEPYMGNLQAASLGSYISGFNTGSMGSWLLMGQGSNPGVPNYVRMGDLYNNLSTGIISHVFRSGSWLGGYTNITYASYVLAGSHAESHSAAAWLSYSDLATGLSPYIVGSQITAYGSAETGSYILAGTGTGSAGWVEMSGLGTKIEFQETATAEELQANTGTIYFPVIQNGKIYGVTANDFYILMNAGQ